MGTDWVSVDLEASLADLYKLTDQMSLLTVSVTCIELQTKNIYQLAKNTAARV